MGWFTSKAEQAPQFPWRNLQNLQQWQEIVEDRNGAKNLVFKHSTRCSISIMAKRRMEQDWQEKYEGLNIWFLDLLNHRDISNKIEESTGITHQSPQLIALENGEIKYEASHGQINLRKAAESF